jgi:autoinducer 2-degrading protein
MYVVCVTVKVKEENVDQFIEAMGIIHAGTRTEPGNVRYDVLQAEDDPTKFFIYEAYHRKDDFPAHQQTPHYLEWREKVADWMAEPRSAVRHHSLFPADQAEKW